MKYRLAHDLSPTCSAVMMPIIGKKITGRRAVIASGRHSVHQYRDIRMRTKPHLASCNTTTFDVHNVINGKQKHINAGIDLPCFHQKP